MVYLYLKDKDYNALLDCINYISMYSMDWEYQLFVLVKWTHVVFFEF